DGLIDEGCGTTSTDSGLTDLDGDGFTTDDCDDNDPTVHPGAEDLCDDGLDQDCDGMDAHCGGTTTDDTGLVDDGDDDGDLGGIGCTGTGRSYAVVAALPLLLLGRRRRSR
ncbi:MAG: putative metal-binding motif-containing protein, partial [Myxococcales bacterium]|nr:putative metal-binding motif-containing protein [Myxococcales bacterium]